jgi:hypothetical protein
MQNFNVSPCLVDENDGVKVQSWGRGGGGIIIIMVGGSGIGAESCMSR